MEHKCRGSYPKNAGYTDQQIKDGYLKVAFRNKDRSKIKVIKKKAPSRRV